MKKILVTGGTVFVSKYVAEYFAIQGYEVYVLNRNTRPQCEGVTLIEADRNSLGEALRGYHFDAVLDITSYTAKDVENLLNALGSFKEYIFVSSSAVYPEYEVQPFKEETKLSENKYWGMYGTNKIEAEKLLMNRVPNAYILRPPYLYGPMNNVYREAFVFDCAMEGREFYLPKDGQMKLQFFHVKDLCKVMEEILHKKPKMHVFNVGNKEAVTIHDWVNMCYRAAGAQLEVKNVYEESNIGNYFCFTDYEYMLDVIEQDEVLNDTITLEEGLKEAFLWYKDHQDEVNKKPYFEYIDEHLK